MEDKHDRKRGADPDGVAESQQPSPSTKQAKMTPEDIISRHPDDDDGKICSKCSVTKDRQTDYYKKQRKKTDDGVCKPCWDNRDKPNYNPKNQVEKKKKSRVIDPEEKHAYMMTYGVGYESPIIPWMGCNAPEGLLRDSRDLDDHHASSLMLVGDYQVIFYASFKGSSYEEEISRTARGMLKLRMSDWDGTPALYGLYRLDESDSTGRAPFDGDECGLGCSSSTAAEFIENSVGWEGQSWYACHNMNGNFVVSRDANSNDVSGKSLVNGLPKEEDEVDCLDDLCWATLSVLTRRVPLGLGADKLHDIKYRPTAYPYSSLIEEEEKDGLEKADALMTKYKDGSNSWMCHHLEGVDSKLATEIRAFVTPPVFYLEPHDLIFQIRETKECEWHKLVVFRKTKNDS